MEALTLSEAFAKSRAKRTHSVLIAESLLSHWFQRSLLGPSGRAPVRLKRSTLSPDLWCLSITTIRLRLIEVEAGARNREARLCFLIFTEAWVTMHCSQLLWELQLDMGDYQQRHFRRWKPKLCETPHSLFIDSQRRPDPIPHLPSIPNTRSQKKLLYSPRETVSEYANAAVTLRCSRPSSR